MVPSCWSVLFFNLPPDQLGALSTAESEDFISSQAGSEAGAMSGRRRKRRGICRRPRRRRRTRGEAAPGGKAGAAWCCRARGVRVDVYLWDFVARLCRAPGPVGFSWKLSPCAKSHIRAGSGIKPTAVQLLYVRKPNAPDSIR